MQCHQTHGGYCYAALSKVGNLGIHLMRSFASGMHHEHRDSRNCLTMRFVEVQDAAHGATTQYGAGLR